MTRLFFRPVLISTAFLMCFCSNGDQPGQILEGKWKATWKTSREAFPEVGEDISFSMEGWVDFESDDVTITAYGYPGCIFSADTLQHSQKWVLKNDTLEMLNEGDVRGISYLLKQKSEDSIELVLMGDIYVSLTR